MRTYLINHQVLNADSSGWTHGTTKMAAESANSARKAALNVLQSDHPGRRCVVRKVNELSGPILGTKGGKSK